jgi:hypothetical protein
MAIDPLMLLGGPAGVGPATGGSPLTGPGAPVPPPGSELLSGLQALMGLPQDQSEVVLQKLRPAIQKLHELADYISQAPDIAPLIQAYAKLVLGGRATTKEQRQTAAGARSAVGAMARPAAPPVLGGPVTPAPMP